MDNPAKRRKANQRTIAELLRRLSQKRELDEDAKDMAATIVFCLREISTGVEQTVTAWEKRDYWMKAERFLREWEWAGEMAANLEDVIRNEAWDLLPSLLAELFPRYTDIQIKTMTRKPDVWRGAHRRLLEQPASDLPW
jgi:hypothetical protein